MATDSKAWPGIGISVVIQYLSVKPIQPSVATWIASAGVPSRSETSRSGIFLNLISCSWPSDIRTTPSCSTKNCGVRGAPWRATRP